MLDSWTQNLLFPQPSQPAAPLLVIQHLAHQIGKGALKKQILVDINLTIYPGEIVILTGASGSGKTTLLSLIGALRSAQAGSLNVFGQELKGASTTARRLLRRNIGFMFRDHHLLPFMTTLQNVRTARQLKAVPNRKIAHSRAESVLTKVGLGGYLNAYPKNLSSGQKQRVAIARAFVNEPTLLLADEPTASLESQIGREVMLMMQRLAKEQRCAVLVVTHDTRILDIADRIIHLEDGRIFQEAIDQAPHVFAALARAVPDRSVLDWAISNGSAPFRTPAIAPAAEPAVQTDKDASENPIFHPLVSDSTPLFFSKLPKNGAPETTVPLQPPPAQKPPAIPAARLQSVCQCFPLQPFRIQPFLPQPTSILRAFRHHSPARSRLLQSPVHL